MADMALDRKLDAWVAAGLLDASAARRIRSYEADADKPLLLWAVAGLGLLALGLGMALLVSANWDRIADWVKLGVHLLLLAGCLAGVWWAGRAPDRLWTGEAALFLTGATLLGGQALHAQIYQIPGPVWHMLMLWLLLMSPLVLLAGKAWLTGIGWSLMLLLGLSAMAADIPDTGAWLPAQGLALAAPALLFLLSVMPWVGTSGFRQALRAVAILFLLAGASLAHLAWATAVTAADAGQWAVRMVPAALACALALTAHRRRPGTMPAPLVRAILIGPLLAVGLAFAIPHPDLWASRLVGVLVYVLMWGWVARAASDAGWGGLFGIAIAAIAVRIFLIYVELFGSLAATGLGLIGGGLLLVVLALGWRRLMRMRTR